MICFIDCFQGAIVAKPLLFDCHDSDISGPDIFQKLVPLVNYRLV